jgi:CRP-like cAMP-binding protein
MTASVPDIISVFFEKYTLNRYTKGQIFLLEGERSDYVYYLIEGRVKVYGISYRGDEIILHVYKPPDFFPVSHVVNQTENKYIYEADTDIAVRRAPIDEVRKLLENHPSVTLNLLKQSYQYINDFLERQSLLMAGSARSRLIYEIIVQCRNFSVEAADKRYVLDIREKDLAARTGVSRETINREVKKLKKDKLITFDHRYLIVPDIDSLEQKLGKSI